MELDTAQSWHLTPTEFDKCEPHEKAEMMAYNWVKSKIETYHYESSSKAAK